MRGRLKVTFNSFNVPRKGAKSSKESMVARSRVNERRLEHDLEASKRAPLPAVVGEEICRANALRESFFSNSGSHSQSCSAL